VVVLVLVVVGGGCGGGSSSMGSSSGICVVSAKLHLTNMLATCWQHVGNITNG